METINKQKGVNGDLKTNVQPTTKAAGVVQPITNVAEAQVPVEGDKMSLLKKWWFWATIGGAVLVIALIFYLFVL